MATTLAQQKAVAIAPKFTSFASILGSSTCIFLLLKRSPKKKTYHRLVLGMSLCDLSASTAWFFTTWPIPAGTEGVYGAVGNQQTCSAQAFFAQFSLSTVMYNASLAIYYVMVVVNNRKDADIVRIEPFLHLNSIIWGLGTALASLALTLFNQVGWDCWISASPLGCKETWQLEPGEVTTCERGDNGSLYQWAFYYAPLWFVILLVSGLMYWVYATVRKQEIAMKKYAGSIVSEEERASRKEKMTQSKKVAMQAFHYVGAFLVTWTFPTLFQIVIVSASKFPFPLLFLTALFVPIQGLLNLIVFIRPKFIRYRTRYPAGNGLVAWFRMLHMEVKGTYDSDRGGSTVVNRKASSVEDKDLNESKKAPKFHFMGSFRASFVAKSLPKSVQRMTSVVEEESKHEEDEDFYDNEDSENGKQELPNEA